MKVVILAGGAGTRLSEETSRIPKALVKVGNSPILIHLMKYYSSYGYKNFVICLGYKGDLIKNFFSNQKKKSLKNFLKTGKIQLLNTGKNSFTGERIRKIKIM